MAVTRLRGKQTRANEKYDPKGAGLASDAEVEARVQQHSSLFHHNRTDVTKLIFDTQGDLTDIKTFNNDDEDILLAHSAFTFSDGNISVIEKKIYSSDGSALYMHLKKTFNFDANGSLQNIQNEKII